LSGTFLCIEHDVSTKKKILNVEYEWEGYYIQYSKKGPMKIQMSVEKDGTVKGKGVDSNGPFSINGTHDNYTSISFIKKMETINSWSIYYDGEFIDDVTIEGKYSVNGFLGNFKIFIKDLVSHLPYEDKMLRWDGYWINGEVKGGMQILLRLSPDGSVTGNGVDLYGPFSLNGEHVDYKKISWTKKMEIPNGWSIYYTGTVTPDNQIEGYYNVSKSTGPFKFWLA